MWNTQVTSPSWNALSMSERWRMSPCINLIPSGMVWAGALMSNRITWTLLWFRAQPRLKWWGVKLRSNHSKAMPRKSVQNNFPTLLHLPSVPYLHVHWGKSYANIPKWESSHSLKLQRDGSIYMLHFLSLCSRTHHLFFGIFINGNRTERIPIIFHCFWWCEHLPSPILWLLKHFSWHGIYL